MPTSDSDTRALLRNCDAGECRWVSAMQHERERRGHPDLDQISRQKDEARQSGRSEVHTGDEGLHRNPEQVDHRDTADQRRQRDSPPTQGTGTDDQPDHDHSSDPTQQIASGRADEDPESAAATRQHGQSNSSKSEDSEDGEGRTSRPEYGAGKHHRQSLRRHGDSPRQRHGHRPQDDDQRSEDRDTRKVSGFETSGCRHENTFLNTVHLNGVQYTQIMFAERNSPRHDRGSVTETALRLLDEVGLPDLSMRRLATELGVQPSALYWHFDSKQALLAAVADRILDRIDATPDATPVLTVARGIRDALLAYRDGAEVVMSSYALGLGADRAHTRLAAALRPAHTSATEPGETIDTAATASVLLQFILGHALLVQQRLHAESHGASLPTMELDPSSALDATFDLGIRTFLAGIPSAQDPSTV